MRMRISFVGLALLIGLPWLFAATALQGSCEYLTGETAKPARPPAPAPPGGRDGAAGQAAALAELQQNQKAEADGGAVDDPARAERSAALLAAVDAGTARLLAANVADFGQTADGRIICRDYYGRFFSIKTDGTGPQPWGSGWDPRADGWDIPEEAEYDLEANRLIVSPDGNWAAYTRLVSTAVPGQDYSARCNAVILCSSAGGDGRCVALTEEVDGAPQLDFSADSARLCALWFIPGEPTAEHYASLIASTDERLWKEGNYSYIEVASGRRGMLQGYENTEMYDKCPLSDNFSYQELDSMATFFGNFTSGGELGRYTPPGETDWTIFSQWVLPDAVLLSFAGPRQVLIFTDGDNQAAPEGAYWRCFCTFDDGACLFSRDGGASIEYGKVDWNTFTVDWSVARPDLTAFAEPLEMDSELPIVLHRWQPLRDGSGVLVSEPANGGLYLHRVSKEGAKP